ncbi:probable G-protein coupled receptor 139 [Saccostrea echinata]|uniref:probable G-protein coupled receptor 139 n=1 Tax=Saccostrea echinata TaxID=191078 RepID=UPI002A80957E|nr:probable G-protein coupled receptor 139 [Saccostrea echinata]
MGFLDSLKTTMALNETLGNNLTRSLYNESSTLLAYDYNIYPTFCPEAVAVDKYVTPYTYVIGFPGNVFSLLIWLQRRMRNSSGYYLAALALVDLLFLLLQVVYELNEKWEVKCLDLPFVCEFYPIIFLTSQYLSPILVLSFTVERYISICHPFKRETWCTTRNAKLVIIGTTLGCLCVNSIQGFFWSYDSENKTCLLRHSVIENGTESFWAIWTWCVEAFVFLLVPLAILFFNILVIVEARRLSKFEQTTLHTRTYRNSATTVMLLAVSFYQIFTTLPVTIVVTLYYTFPPGDINVLPTITDTWKAHFQYYWAKTIIEEIGLTHYAGNFYIYLLTGKVFRKEFKKLMRPLFGGLKEKLTNTLKTEYSIVRTGSVKPKKEVKVCICNGNENENLPVSTESEPILSSPETHL